MVQLFRLTVIAAKHLHTNFKLSNMKQLSQLWILAIVVMVFLSSCEIIGDILKVGVWLGIVIAALIVGLIIWIAIKFRR
jgi:type IV secretory pathway TrbL component